jgi:hypothetical protein
MAVQLPAHTTPEAVAEHLGCEANGERCRENGEYWKMALVVIIDGDLPAHAEQDMRRWWSYGCKKHVHKNDVFFEVAGKFKLYEGVKRLASFGVKAHVGRRKLGFERT